MGRERMIASQVPGKSLGQADRWGFLASHRTAFKSEPWKVEEGLLKEDRDSTNRVRAISGGERGPRVWGWQFL